VGPGTLGSAFVSRSRVTLWKDKTVSSPRTAQVLVTNDFDNPANIKLTHRSGNQPDEQMEWVDVAFAETGDPPLNVHFATGFGSPLDYWQVVVDVVAGPNQGTWANDGWKECYLTADDDGRTLVFSVSASNGLKLNMVSSSCSATLNRAASS
jgi:hypothetical protein